MQAQFQQFVKDNQGKLIQFLHNDVFVSKFVVDIQDEYFTCKSYSSDSKIDGFYYFSDCKMHEHPLISVLEKHKITVLNLSTGNSCVFKYNLYCFDKVNGTCLTTSQPVAFHVDSIKEVWTILDNKNTKVYPLQESTIYKTVESALRDHKNVVLGYSKMVVPTSITKIDETFIYGICPLIGSETQHQLSAVKNIFTIVNGEWKCIYKQDTPSPMNKLSTYFEAQNNVKNACDKVNNSFGKVFKSIDKENSPFTESYPNGVLKCMGTYKNGKLHGRYQEWFDNGKQSLDFEYNEGKIYGHRIVNNKDGNILSYEVVKPEIRVNINVEEDFHNQYYLSSSLCDFLGLNIHEKYQKKDIINSVFTYCLDLVVIHLSETKIIPDEKLHRLIGDRLVIVITFSELQRILNKHFLSPDEEIVKQRFIDPLQQQYLKVNEILNNNIKSVDKEDINYKYPGILSGRAYTRYPSGKVKTDTFYKDGKFHGWYTEYHENGNIKIKAFYKDGKLNGYYLEYYENGHIFKHIEYKNGLNHGNYLEYKDDSIDHIVSSHRFFKDGVEVKK